MIKKRLLEIVPESRKYIGANVALQWISLVANIVMMAAICGLISDLWYGKDTDDEVVLVAAIVVTVLVIRAACTMLSSKMSFLSSRTVKKRLREMIYSKLLRLGASYREDVDTAEVVQISVEGVDQLETYFGSYLPQFFYAMLAPLTLFVYFLTINIPSAVLLFVCVPLIPIAIVAVQRFAKKILAKYWGKYTELGSSFLEDLQGLTTLKIYQSDGYKNDEMNKEAEGFRVVTMKVLSMQLNSIIVMDIIAYGGAALGLILAVTQFDSGNVDLAGCLLIILLSSEFFIPMRMLGSYFHVAMNGMAASDKIFRVLDLPEPEAGESAFPDRADIRVEDVDFSYTPDRKVLDDVTMEFAPGRLTSIVGESGSGKSTVASILMKRSRGYTGRIEVGDVDLADVSEASLLDSVTYVSHESHLFKGTVRANLLMARPDASDGELWNALEQVRLDGFLRGENGLDTVLTEGAANLSGGQRQRLAMARALLHGSQVYILDEATSNIDAESEEAIMDVVRGLVGTRTVILISHRLANVVGSDRIYVMEHGRVCEQGTHDELLSRHGVYEGLWSVQRGLETYGVKGAVQ